MNSRQQLKAVINDMTSAEAQRALDFQNRFKTTCTGGTIARFLEKHVNNIAKGMKPDPYQGELE